MPWHAMPASRKPPLDLLHCWSPCRSAAVICNLSTDVPHNDSQVKLIICSLCVILTMLLLSPLQDEAAICYDLVTTIVRLPTANSSAANATTVDALLPVYDTMHTAACGVAPPLGAAAKGQNAPWGPDGWASTLESMLDSAVATERAGPALACGGLLAGVARFRSHGRAQQLMHRLQHRLERLCANVVGNASSASSAARLVLEAAALATWLSQQACGLPPPGGVLWRCQLHALLDGLLSMDRLYEAARCPAELQKASAALNAWQQGRAAQMTGPVSESRFRITTSYTTLVY